RFGARFEATHWPAPLRPYRAFALLGPACPRRTCLAALAIGAVDAIAVPVAWLYRPLSLGQYPLYDLAGSQSAVSMVGWLAPLLAWALPAIGVVFCVYELVHHDFTDVGRVLLLLRSVSIGSNVSPLTPLLLLAGVPYLFAWLHLERMRVGRDLLRVRHTRWKVGAVLGTAAFTLGALAVLFESKWLSTLEGPFGDGAFGALLGMAAVVVTTTFAW